LQRSSSFPCTILIFCYVFSETCFIIKKNDNNSGINYEIHCMGLIYLLKGIAIGFSLAAPVGPVGVLCIRRTLAHGSKRGLIVGLSAASADMLYGIFAAYGVTLVSDFIYSQQQWIRLIGGVILFALGYHTIRSHPSTDTATNGTNGHMRAFFSTFLLTLTNPMTLFAFAAVFASVGLEEIIGNQWFALFLVVGIFLGSMSWFALLTTLVHFFKEKISTDGISLVNKIAGSIFIIFGILALSSSLIGF
jgi:threonine/homoserine/homoserine lactone efflux protein